MGWSASQGINRILYSLKDKYRVHFSLSENIRIQSIAYHKMYLRASFISSSPISMTSKASLSFMFSNKNHACNSLLQTMPILFYFIGWFCLIRLINPCPKFKLSRYTRLDRVYGEESSFSINVRFHTEQIHRILVREKCWLIYESPKLAPVLRRTQYMVLYIYKL